MNTAATAEDERPFKFRSKAVEVKGDGGTKTRQHGSNFSNRGLAIYLRNQAFFWAPGLGPMNAAGYNLPGFSCRIRSMSGCRAS